MHKNGTLEQVLFYQGFINRLHVINTPLPVLISLLVTEYLFASKVTQ